MFLHAGGAHVEETIGQKRSDILCVGQSASEASCGRLQTTIFALSHSPDEISTQSCGVCGTDEDLTPTKIDLHDGNNRCTVDSGYNSSVVL